MDMSLDIEKGVCSICLSPYADKVIGFPNTCKHQFCLQCILLWAKDSNLCPIDRVPFQRVKILFEDKVLAQADIKKKKREKNERELYDFSVTCEVCNNDKVGIVILCDACDLGYHKKCLKPALKRVPPGDWFCPTCKQILLSSDRKKLRGRPKRVTQKKSQFNKHGKKSEDLVCNSSSAGTSRSLPHRLRSSPVKQVSIPTNTDQQKSCVLPKQLSFDQQSESVMALGSRECQKRNDDSDENCDMDDIQTPRSGLRPLSLRTGFASTRVRQLEHEADLNNDNSFANLTPPRRCLRPRSRPRRSKPYLLRIRPTLKKEKDATDDSDSQENCVDDFQQEKDVDDLETPSSRLQLHRKKVCLLRARQLKHQADSNDKDVVQVLDSPSRCLRSSSKSPQKMPYILRVQPGADGRRPLMADAHRTIVNKSPIHLLKNAADTKLLPSTAKHKRTGQHSTDSNALNCRQARLRSSEIKSLLEPPLQEQVPQSIDAIVEKSSSPPKDMSVVLERLPFEFYSKESNMPIEEYDLIKNDSTNLQQRLQSDESTSGLYQSEVSVPSSENQSVLSKYCTVTKQKLSIETNLEPCTSRARLPAAGCSTSLHCQNFYGNSVAHEMPILSPQLPHAQEKQCLRKCDKAEGNIEPNIDTSRTWETSENLFTLDQSEHPTVPVPIKLENVDTDNFYSDHSTDLFHVKSPSVWSDKDLCKQSKKLARGKSKQQKSSTSHCDNTIIVLEDGTIVFPS